MNTLYTFRVKAGSNVTYFHSVQGCDSKYIFMSNAYQNITTEHPCAICGVT